MNDAPWPLIAFPYCQQERSYNVLLTLIDKAQQSYLAHRSLAMCLLTQRKLESWRIYFKQRKPFNSCCRFNRDISTSAEVASQEED